MIKSVTVAPFWTLRPLWCS